MNFLRAPSFDTEAEVVAWLLEQRVATVDIRTELGPDGQWRGSGIVHLENLKGESR